MHLLSWLEQQSLSHAEFGERIKRTAESVRRYANGARIPDRETMPLIVEATAGQVTANDFYAIDHAASLAPPMAAPSPGKGRDVTDPAPAQVAA